jgi:hypothetical protein
MAPIATGSDAAREIRRNRKSEASMATSAATARRNGNGRFCTVAPPVIAFIEAPVQRSNASHSPERSRSNSSAPIGLAVTS